MDRTVALVTCSALPEVDPDEQLVLEPLRRRRIEPVAAAWDDPAVDWAAFDLVVIRSTWDYPTRRPEFIAWAQSVPRLVNPADVVAWNTDKRYLRDLTDAGLPVVTTSWIAPGEPIILPPTGRMSSSLPLAPGRLTRAPSTCATSMRRNSPATTPSACSPPARR